MQRAFERRQASWGNKLRSAHILLLKYVFMNCLNDQAETLSDQLRASNIRLSHIKWPYTLDMAVYLVFFGVKREYFLFWHHLMIELGRPLSLIGHISATTSNLPKLQFCCRHDMKWRCIWKSIHDCKSTYWLSSSCYSLGVSSTESCSTTNSTWATTDFWK